MIERTNATRRRFLRTGVVASLVGTAGCSSNDDGGEAGTAGAVDDVETDERPTDTPRPKREFTADFEDGSTDWSGDVDAIGLTDDSVRGSNATVIGPDARQAELTFPETTVERYSLWWKLSAEPDRVRLEFRGKEDAVGFGAELRMGTHGLEIHVNPESDSSGASDLLSDTVRTEEWYKLTFSAVDFDSERFEVSLSDVGERELIRMSQSFRSSIESVSTFAVRARQSTAIVVDDLGISAET